ncbi:MAG: hemolysin family protein [Thermoguttaceae bacterium]
MTSFGLLAVAMASLAVTCLAAIGGRALAEFSPYALKEIYRRRNRPDPLGQILRRREQVALAVQTLRTLAVAAFAGAGIAWTWPAAAQATPDWLSRGLGLLAGAAGLLAAGIWLPWAVARLWAEPFLYLTWPIWWATSWLLWPLVWVARLVDLALRRLAGRENPTADQESFAEDIRTIVTEGHREGLLEGEAREMIEGVIELGDADVARIMTPRTDMTSLAAALSWPEMLELVIHAGHTRLPVYGRNRDDILGILHAKDLLAELAKPAQLRAEPWTKLLREAAFVPETKPLDALLRELRRSRNHMAMVLDEYGGVSGLVTMEDVLEEIVGEIDDEHDPALADGIRETGPGVYEAPGRAHLDEINERTGLELPEDADYDTIGGFVFSELGHVPVAGEQLQWRNARMTVVEATRRRIERVRIELLDKGD